MDARNTGWMCLVGPDVRSHTSRERRCFHDSHERQSDTWLQTGKTTDRQRPHTSGSYIWAKYSKMTMRLTVSLKRLLVVPARVIEGFCARRAVVPHATALGSALVNNSPPLYPRLRAPVGGAEEEEADRHVDVGRAWRAC